MSTRVAIVTLGCARNEVDSEELAARLSKDGIELVTEPSDADAVFVNTCGFIEAAKKDSIDTLLAANDLKQNSNVKAVLAVGCMAERYGNELEKALPEADAILGFETELRRDERIMRFLTVSLDKHAISWAERRRTKLKESKA